MGARGPLQVKFREKLSALLTKIILHVSLSLSLSLSPSPSLSLSYSQPNQPPIKRKSGNRLTIPIRVGPGFVETLYPTHLAEVVICFLGAESVLR